MNCMRRAGNLQGKLISVRARWQVLLMVCSMVTVTITGMLPASASAAASEPQSSGYTISQCGNNGSRVLLTFDDWPYSDPAMLQSVVKEARSLDVGLMLFPLGKYNSGYKHATGTNLAAFARQNGMYVGNHTYDHPDLTTLSDAQVRSEINGGVDSTWLRPPYGAYNSRVYNIAASLGYRTCTWTIDTGDWHGKSGPEVRDYIMANVRPGSVILMHMQWHAFNPDWLQTTVGRLRAHGYKVCRPWRVDGKISPSPIKLPKSLTC